MNPLKSLEEYGQSVWLDCIRRGLIASGELHRLVTEDGLRGATSNPAIFEKAIAGSTDYSYSAALEDLPRRPDLDAMAIYEHPAIRDIRDGADGLRPGCDETRRGDGYVSLEVCPYLARDTHGTVAEARRLWNAVGRDKVTLITSPSIRDLGAWLEQLLAESTGKEGKGFIPVDHEAVGAPAINRTSRRARRQPGG